MFKYIRKINYNPEEGVKDNFCRARCFLENKPISVNDFMNNNGKCILLGLD